ncbi:MAG: rhodanese-like domain-containing protein [Dehalococcoidales bacterium]|nr:rhodanese-like domain-containing protein [Dehalococcoidales bacterium]
MLIKKFVLLTLLVLLVIGVVLSGGCAPSQVALTATPHPAISNTVTIIENITTQAANTLIQENKSNADFVILDVRTPEEFADGHIENAVNIDFYLATFRDELDRLDKNKTYLVYCRSGSRSFSAAKIMETLKFKKIYNMLDGIIGWRAEGLPTIK